MEERFTKEQIDLILKESQEGADTYELCLRHGISEATLFDWLAQYGYQPNKKGFDYKKFWKELANNGVVTRRELLAASASGAAGFAAGHFFAFAAKNQTESRPPSGNCLCKAPASPPHGSAPPDPAHFSARSGNG